MSEQLFFEDVAVGDQWRSLGRTITETDVVNFAGVTGDYDPLHVDHEYARHAPFGKPIAHGLLGLSLLAGLSSQSPCMKTAAFIRIQNWEFHKPIYIGDTVYAETEVTDKQPEGRRAGRVTWHRRLVNQTGEALQSGVLETLVLVKNVKRKRRKSEPSAESNSTTDTAQEPGES
ncbi:MAG: MaoC/PaaZ C-terminal domain-containing protein [Planctomycetota bacterium]